MAVVRELLAEPALSTMERSTFETDEAAFNVALWGFSNRTWLENDPLEVEVVFVDVTAALNSVGSPSTTLAVIVNQEGFEDE